MTPPPVRRWERAEADYLAARDSGADPDALRELGAAMVRAWARLAREDQDAVLRERAVLAPLEYEA